MPFTKTSRIMTAVAALCFCLLPGSARAEEAATEPPSSGETVVVVNGDAITKGQVDRELSGHQQKMIRAGQPLTPEILLGLREQVIENLIDRTLLHQASVKEGVTVSEEEVDEQFGEIRQQFTSDDAFNSALDQMNMTEGLIREEVRGGIAVHKFVNERFARSAEISEQEARTFYDSHPEAFASPEQVRARHILIQVDPQAGDEAEKEALKALQEIRKEAEAGKAFGELARKHSQCPSKEQGGDLGYFTRGKMVKPFEDAAFALKPGELSGVVHTQFGHHLIKIEDRKAEETVPFEDVQERLLIYLGREAVKEAVQSYVKQLRHDAVIQRPGRDG